MSHTFIIADLSNIEARGVAWIAGQEDLLAKFASGFEVYCEFAEKVLGYPVRKPRPDGIPAIEAKMKWARNMGKVPILGGGYGIGWKKLIVFAASMGVNLTESLSRRLIEVYREENSKIVEFWHDVEAAFVTTYKTGRPHAMPRGLYFYHSNDCDVSIVLPSGRHLRYHKVRLQRDRLRREKVEVWNEQKKGWEHAWGGVFTENIVQAMSRDILLNGIERVEEQEVRVVLHSHDELVGLVKESEAQERSAQVVAAMTTGLDWAEGWPLDAECVIRKEYGGH